MELSFFEEVAEAVRGSVPRELGEIRCRPHRMGVKVWFDDERPPREHYEAQLIGGGRKLSLEVGFHAEHPKVADNDAVLGVLAQHEKRWRRIVGKDAVAGPFLGRADTWRRVSETWPNPDLDDGDLAIEVAARLCDYMTALEPIRRRS